MIGYDDWKTTEPRDIAREWAEVQERAEEEAGEAFDAAADLASLLVAQGLPEEAPDPFLEAAKARERVYLEARRAGL